MGKKVPNKWNCKHNNLQNLLERIPTVPNGSSTSALSTDCWSIILCWPFLSQYIESLTIKKRLSTLSCFGLGFFSTFFSSSFARSRSWQEIAQDTMKDCNHALGRLQISHPFWGNKKPLPSMAKHIKDKNHISLQQSQKGRKMGLDPFLSRLEKKFHNMIPGLIWHDASFWAVVISKC